MFKAIVLILFLLSGVGTIPVILWLILYSIEENQANSRPTRNF